MANQYLHIKNLFSYTIHSDIFYLILFFFSISAKKEMVVCLSKLKSWPNESWLKVWKTLI